MASANPIDELLKVPPEGIALALKVFNAKHTRAMTLNPFSEGDQWKPLSDPPDPLIVVKRSEMTSRGFFYALCEVVSKSSGLTATIRPIAEFTVSGSDVTVSYQLAVKSVDVDGVKLPITIELPLAELSLAGQASKAKPLASGQVRTVAFGPAHYGDVFAELVLGDQPRAGYYQMAEPKKTKIYHVQEAAGGATPGLIIGHGEMKNNSNRKIRRTSTQYPLVASVQVLGYSVGSKIQANRAYDSGVVLNHTQTLYVPWIISLENASETMKKVTDGLAYQDGLGWTDTTTIRSTGRSILENFVGLGATTAPSSAGVATSSPPKQSLRGKFAYSAALTIMNVMVDRTDAYQFAEETDLQRLKGLFAAFKVQTDLFDGFVSTMTVPPDAAVVTSIFNTWKAFSSDLAGTFGADVLSEVQKMVSPWATIVKIRLLGVESFKKVYDELSNYDLVDARWNDPPLFLGTLFGLGREPFEAADVSMLTRPAFVVAVWLRVVNDMNRAGFENLPFEWYTYHDKIIDQIRKSTLIAETGGKAKFFDVTLVSSLPIRTDHQWRDGSIPRLEKFMKFVNATKKAPFDLNESVNALHNWFIDQEARKTLADLEIGMPTPPGNSEFWKLAHTPAGKAALSTVQTGLLSGAKSSGTDVYTYVSTNFASALATLQTIYNINPPPSATTAPASAKPPSGPPSSAATAPASTKPPAGPPSTTLPFVSIPYSSQGLSSATAVAMPVKNYSVAIQLFIGGKNVGLFYSPSARPCVFIGRGSPSVVRSGPFMAVSVDPANIVSCDPTAVVSAGKWRTEGADLCNGDVKVAVHLGAPNVTGWMADPSKTVSALLASGGTPIRATFAKDVLGNPNAATAFGMRGTFMFIDSANRLAVAVVHAQSDVLIRGIYAFV